MELTVAQIVQAALAAFLVGLTKTGVPGLGILIVGMLAAVFPDRASTGVLLPMLLFGDFFAIAYHRRNVRWPIIVKLLPWVLVGIGTGYVALGNVGGDAFRVLLGGLVLGLIGLRVFTDLRGTWLEEHVPHTWWFSAVFGVMAGFATMVGNVAGGIMAVYLLSMGLKKHSFMGTGAWFYLIVNSIKIPLSASLGLINVSSLTFDLKVAPLIVVGAVVGFLVFTRIPQKWFSRIILVLAALAALRLLLLA